MRVDFTVAALAELEQIADHVSQDSARAAERLVITLGDKAREIGRAPLLFPLVPGHETAGIRRRVHRDYLIFYRLDPHAVTILHIGHGARDWEIILAGEG